MIGKSVKRVDAYDKVTGRAKYTDDLCPKNALIAKILHSNIAFGRVLKIDLSKAEKIPGVVKIVTCFDVPDILFPTAGHPWSTDVGHQDVADRKLLTDIVRYYGDDIAAVIAKDEIAAKRAICAIEVEYEEYEPMLKQKNAINGRPIHSSSPDNIIKHTIMGSGDFDEAIKEEGLHIFSASFETPIVQHCHIENATCYSYMENSRITVVTSTQIPHIVRRVIGQALGIDWGMVRVIKPYIGGGFGNKQDVLYEPLCAYLSKVMGGKCVSLSSSREETFTNTRTRHAIEFELTTAIRSDGTIVAKKLLAYSNEGGYAAHGHSVVANAAGAFSHLYKAEKASIAEAFSVYTNMPVSGAMRGYGVPQMNFAFESHIEDIAQALKIPSIEIRKKNMVDVGDITPGLNIKINTCGIRQCMEMGNEFLDFTNKQAQYKNQSGAVRRGVGMAAFSYKTGVYPISLEVAGCKINVNQDGSVMAIMGATEIGQGADTALSQIIAEAIGINIDKVHVVSAQDTDVCPYDSGAYASRQTYVSGMAAKKAALEVRENILSYAALMLECSSNDIDICGDDIIAIADKQPIIALSRVTMEAAYSLDNAKRLSADVLHQCKDNAVSYGATFAEVEVDMELCKVKILKIVNVHDCGRLINPQLAQAQVHGGMGMGIGYALSEQMLFDDKGKPLNGNLLDYKMPTSMDLPELTALFYETNEQTAPYGNKSLGEPPIITQSGAIRNAILNATDHAFYQIPITPHRLFEKFHE